MKTVFISLLIFISLCSSAQEVISTQGESFSNASISLDWTIGETVVETFSDSSYQLTQGFHQPQLIITAIEDIKDAFSIKIFPNPTKAFIHLNLERPEDHFVYQLYDINGKLLKENVINDSQVIIQMGEFSSGSYFLVVKHKKEKLGTYKIQKIN